MASASNENSVAEATDSMDLNEDAANCEKTSCSEEKAADELREDQNVTKDDTETGIEMEPEKLNQSNDTLDDTEGSSAKMELNENNTKQSDVMTPGNSSEETPVSKLPRLESADNNPMVNVPIVVKPIVPVGYIIIKPGTAQMVTGTLPVTGSLMETCQNVAEVELGNTTEQGPKNPPVDAQNPIVNIQNLVTNTAPEWQRVHMDRLKDEMLQSITTRPAIAPQQSLLRSMTENPAKLNPTPAIELPTVTTDQSERAGLRTYAGRTRANRAVPHVDMGKPSVSADLSRSSTSGLASYQQKRPGAKTSLERTRAYRQRLWLQQQGEIVIRLCGESDRGESSEGLSQTVVSVDVGGKRLAVQDKRKEKTLRITKPISILPKPAPKATPIPTPKPNIVVTQVNVPPKPPNLDTTLQNLRVTNWNLLQVNKSLQMQLDAQQQICCSCEQLRVERDFLLRKLMELENTEKAEGPCPGADPINCPHRDMFTYAVNEIGALNEKIALLAQQESGTGQRCESPNAVSDMRFSTWNPYEAIVPKQEPEDMPESGDPNMEDIAYDEDNDSINRDSVLSETTEEEEEEEEEEDDDDDEDDDDSDYVLPDTPEARMVHEPDVDSEQQSDVGTVSSEDPQMEGDPNQEEICKWCEPDESGEWKECGLVFEDRNHLSKHVLHHVPSGTSQRYTCEWKGCKRKRVPYRLRTALVSHIGVHMARNVTRLRCPYPDCSRAYANLAALTLHQQKHETGNYACGFPGCSATFKTAAVRSAHRRMRH